MHAGRVAFGFRSMTAGAVRGPGWDIVIGMFGTDVRMTTCASISFVHRTSQPGKIHKQRDFLAGRSCRREGLVPMAFHAGAVADESDGGGGSGRFRDDYASKDACPYRDNECDQMGLRDSHTKEH